MAEVKLPEAVSKAYSLKRNTPAKFYVKGVGDIEVATMTIGQADALHAAKCEYLVKGKTQPAETK